MQGAADEGEGDGLVLVVGDLDDGLGGPAVDQLDAEDVGVGEGPDDVGLELGDSGAAGIFVQRLWGG